MEDFCRTFGQLKSRWVDFLWTTTAEVLLQEWYSEKVFSQGGCRYWTEDWRLNLQGRMWKRLGRCQLKRVHQSCQYWNAFEEEMKTGETWSPSESKKPYFWTRLKTCSTQCVLLCYEECGCLSTCAGSSIEKNLLLALSLAKWNNVTPAIEIFLQGLRGLFTSIDSLQWTWQA